MQKIIERNIVLEKDMHDKENKYLELFDEYNMMHEDMQELQDQLDEMGLLHDEGSETGDGGKKKMSIPGVGKMKNIFKKSRKIMKVRGKNRSRNFKDAALENEQESENLKVDGDKITGTKINVAPIEEAKKEKPEDNPYEK